jgi:hypothetical protein
MVTTVISVSEGLLGLFEERDDKRKLASHGKPLGDAVNRIENHQLLFMIREVMDGVG